jgi:hypothetical protein
VPRFFFHIHDDEDTVPDTEGMVFLDVETARREGEQSARELLAADIRAGRAVDRQRVEVVQEDGSSVATYFLRDLIN